MKSNEFRIGNLVLIDSEILGIISEIRGNHAKVLYKGEVNAEVSERFSLIEFLRLDPITLTEEWLLNMGFTREKFNYNWVFGNFIYNEKLNLWTWYGIQLHDYLIDSVHKLQNLHFALTGIELTIK